MKKASLILGLILTGLFLFGCTSTYENPCEGIVDIGPSPGRCISVENTSSYPEYDFYYDGEMFGPALIDGKIEIYKLEHKIVIFALPKGTTQVIDPSNKEAITSQTLSLTNPYSKFTITSFNKETQTITLEEIN